MKKSKLLFLVPSVAVATSMPFVASCSKSKWTFGDLEDAVFNPVDEQQTPEKDTFIEQLKSVSEKEQQKEIIYALYSPIVNLEMEGASIKEWYEDHKITIVENINKCNMEFNNDKIIINFIGYINFVFVEDFEQHHKNDFLQVTFLMDRCNLAQIAGWGFYFPDLSLSKPERAYGFIEAVQEGQRSLPFPIFELYPKNPRNWHNWNK